MSNGKVKTYSNPERNKQQTVFKPYVPQYRILDIEPEEFKSAVVPADYPVARPSADNPRVRQPSIRQPYASVAQSPVGRGRGPIPNVGNNIEHTWSGVDAEIIDDLTSGQEIDLSHQMIDNNDYVTSEALGLPPDSEAMPSLNDGKVTQQKKLTTQRDFQLMVEQDSQSSKDDTMSVLQDMEEESYLLIVDGVSICSGPFEEIEEQARALVFGEHDLCEGQPIPVEDIIIMKRIAIKVGLFLQP